jgi:hypothetical protein
LHFYSENCSRSKPPVRQNRSGLAPSPLRGEGWGGGGVFRPSATSDRHPSLKGGGVLGNEIISSQPYFLCWNFLTVHVPNQANGKAPQSSLEKRRKEVLCRHGRGASANCSGNKRACRPNASGLQRRRSGTITARFSESETLTGAGCPMFPNLILLNRLN